MQYKIGCSDDYASMWNDLIDFYYGYEYGIKKGKLKNGSFNDGKWAFVFKVSNQVVEFYSTKELEKFCPDIKGRMPERYLLAGIGKLISDGKLSINLTLTKKDE